MRKVLGGSSRASLQPQRSSRAAASITLLCVALWHTPASADDMCAAPESEVKKLLGALNHAVPGSPKPGVFRVANLNPNNAPARFRATLVIDGKPVYEEQLTQRSEVSDDLAVNVSKTSAAALDLYYGFGGGGGISCKYRIYPSHGRFVASKTK